MNDFFTVTNIFHRDDRYRAMLYDEDGYPDPSAFKDGQLDPSIRDPA